MDKAKFIEETIAVLSAHQSQSINLQNDSASIKRLQLASLDQLITSYKRCGQLANTDDERFGLITGCLTPVLDQVPGEQGYTKDQQEKRLYAFESIQKLANPWVRVERMTTETGQMAENEPMAQTEGEKPTAEPETTKKEKDMLYVEAPKEIEEAIQQKEHANAPKVKPGFIDRYLYRWKVEKDNVEVDNQIGTKGRSLRIELQKQAFAMGFTAEECTQIGREISSKFLEDFYLDKKRNSVDYFLYSKTFREHPIGIDFLTAKGQNLNIELLQKLDVADRLRDDLIRGFPVYTTSEKRVAASFNLLTDNVSKMFSDPTDTKLASQALETAMRIGYNESQAKRIADEVYRLSDGQNLAQTGVTMALGGKAQTLYDFLGQSPTFMADQRGRGYLLLAQANQEVDHLFGVGEEGLTIGAAYEQPTRITTKAGIGLGASSAMSYALADPPEPQVTADNTTTSQVNRQTENQQRQTGIQGLFSSTIGRVVMMILFFFIAKQAGLSSLMSGLLAGGGGLFLPKIGDLLGGIFETQSNANVPTSLLDQAQQRYAVQDIQAQQLDIINQRHIEEGVPESMQRSYSDQQLFAVLKEGGFQGLQQYLDNDVQKYNSFVTQHNLTELAQNEQSIRHSNGDWLKATQSALNMRNQVAQNVGQSVSNSMKLNV